MAAACTAGAGAEALVRLLDRTGAALQATPDGALRFVAAHECGSQPAGAWDASVWLLAAVGGAEGGNGQYTLQEAANGRFLTAMDGQLALSSTPVALQLFMDLERSERG